jgi:D-tyrosyl-tRNA(Tyr) deacylase
MKAVIQRVRDATVTVDGEIVGSIEAGLLIYYGVAKGDELKQAAWLADKIVKLRVFHDENGKMNRALSEVGAQVLVISQFTLLANLRKGNRPSWDDAAEPEHAEHLYEYFLQQMRERVPSVASGTFGAHMDVRYTNDGPVTFILEA